MLIFVDESEWPRPLDPQGYTVWAAVALAEQNSKVFSRELFNLKKKFWDIQEPHDFEVKGRLLLNQRALTSPKKLEFVEETMSLCKLHKLQIFAIGLKSFSQSTLLSTDQRLFQMFRLLLERIEQMMTELQSDDVAVMLFDSGTEKENAQRALAFGNFIYGTEAGRALQKVLDTPYLRAIKVDTWNTNC